MQESSWINLAIQIPIVVLFAYVMLKMQDRFLQHLDENEARSKEFLRAQRTEDNEALKDLTDRMCLQLDQVGRRMDAMAILDVAHDAFVRTSFRERFGPVIAERAEDAARAAEAAITRK